MLLAEMNYVIYFCQQQGLLSKGLISYNRIHVLFLNSHKNSVGFPSFTHRSDGEAASASIIDRTLQYYELSVVLLFDATGVESSIIVQEQGGAAVTGVGGWCSHH